MIAFEMDDCRPREEFAVVAIYPEGGPVMPGMVTDQDMIERRVAAHQARGAQVKVMRRVWTPSEWERTEEEPDA